jgi:hypothetical protein
MNTQFIRIGSRIIRLDSISYIDFLESGRSMIFMRGLNQEKQNVSFDVEDTRRLREFFESQALAIGGAKNASVMEEDVYVRNWRLDRRSVA